MTYGVAQSIHGLLEMWKQTCDYAPPPKSVLGVDWSIWAKCENALRHALLWAVNDPHIAFVFWVTYKQLCSLNKLKDLLYTIAAECKTSRECAFVELLLVLIHTTMLLILAVGLDSHSIPFSL